MSTDDKTDIQRTLSEHLLSSAVIDQTFRIKVLLPRRRSDATERFPVLYLTDSDDFFGGVTDLTKILQDRGEIARFILVGIGYDNPDSALLRRTRDLFTHEIRRCITHVLEQVIHSPRFGDVTDLKTVTETTDAQHFLHFIRAELMPFIESRYPVVPGDNTYYGYSAGATFGLYALFSRPAPFRRYILGSPGTAYYGRHFGIELAQKYFSSYRDLHTQVFLSVGELEEFDSGLEDVPIVSGYYRLVQFLRSAAIPGLELTARLFGGESHSTAWTAAYAHGVKKFFGRRCT